MPTREVPREEWVSFCDSFSRQHEGWRVTVEVLGAEIGAQNEARELPLGGVTAELNGGREERIEIMVGEGAGDHITHTIMSPRRVYVEETVAGAHEALEIESPDGVKTLLRFRSPTLPEMVDGVVS